MYLKKKKEGTRISFIIRFFGNTVSAFANISLKNTYILTVPNNVTAFSSSY